MAPYGAAGLYEATCTAPFPYGAEVTLIARPDPAAPFLSWKFGCTPAATDPRRCVLTATNRPNWVGVAIVADPFSVFDPRIDPSPDDGVVRSNAIVGNGKNPDPARPGTPSADIVYDGSSATQCFANNVFGTDSPAGITALFPCP